MLRISSFVPHKHLDGFIRRGLKRGYFVLWYGAVTDQQQSHIIGIDMKNPVDWNQTDFLVVYMYMHDIRNQFLPPFFFYFPRLHLQCTSPY